jgi:hypothetical protein
MKTRTLASTALSDARVTEATLTGRLCYVDGCYVPVALTARHRRFGLVTSCTGHDPARHGCALPIVPNPPVPPTAEPDENAPYAELTQAERIAHLFRGLMMLIQEPPDTGGPSDGGALVPRRPIPPHPPLPDALAIPNIEEMF